MSTNEMKNVVGGKAMGGGCSRSVSCGKYVNNHWEEGTCSVVTVGELSACTCSNASSGCSYQA